MLPSVTSFQIFKKPKDPLSAPMELFMPRALPVPSASRAPSHTPWLGTLPCAPHPWFCKRGSSLLSRLQSPMPASPGLSPLMAPGTSNSMHLNRTHPPHPASPPVFSISWSALPSLQLPKAPTQCLSHLHPFSAHTLLIWTLKFSFVCPLSIPMTMVSAQPAIVLLSMAPTAS